MGTPPQPVTTYLTNPADLFLNQESGIADRRFGTSFYNILRNSPAEAIFKADCTRIFQIGDG
jgi:hypothetical protein